ncbi:heat shock protein DnaJ domain protein [Thalassoporum mexicanum PCC 7367]|uniref:J domain-containing protein n=1 Tax=Thalassoporum mexicanum TaxID=3457544 RepID=UPI00029F8F39|nr:J domain-containing protein [Pseudanabaena sp. PCC 7367]AFY70650.1 heat shock protein DnaJ domain protein [Pseudanabaena sp. PCC 7367]
MHQFECYRVLGLPRNASLDDVKTAYRRLARKYHPDINRDDPTAADKFRLVQEAYQLLKNTGNEPTIRPHRSPQAGVKVRTAHHSDRSDRTANPDRHNHTQRSHARNAQPNQKTNAGHRPPPPPPKTAPPKPSQETKQTTKERRAQWFANAAKRKYRKSSANGGKNKKRTTPGSSNGSNIDPEVKLKSDTLRRLQDLLKQKKYVVAIAVAEGMREKFSTSPEVIHWQAVSYHRWGSDLLMQGDFKKAELYLNKALTTDPRNRELCFEVKRDLERIGRHQSQDDN